jgi:branched-chain amino acid aminotransferase
MKINKSLDPSAKGSADRAKLKVWLDGKFVKYNDAKVPILTHSLQYGSGIFEGIRAYEAKNGTAIFRLKDHVKRFFNTAKIDSMPMKFTDKQISKAIVDCVRINKLKSCYIRPFGFYNVDQIGVSAYGKKVSVFIASIPFGAYFGAGKEKGIRCKISSWHRINSEILPVEAKNSGNYINSILANYEAKNAGFDEAIFISGEGYLAEGSGENLFLVKNGRLVTPDASADILLGITRDSIIKIAESMGIEVEERAVHREELDSADEVFFTGTAAEITPIVNVDGIKMGKGKPGPITKMLAQKYGNIVAGEDDEFEDWLTYV